MALPSQVDQRADSAGRTYSQPKPGRSKPVLIAAAGLILVGLAFLIWASRPKGTLPPVAGVENGSGPGSKSPPAGGTSTSAKPGDAGAPGSNPDQPGPLTKALDHGSKPAPVDLNSPSGARPTGAPRTGDAGANPPGSPSGTLPPSGASDELRFLIDGGEKKLQGGDALGARSLWAKSLLDPRSTRADQDALRAKLATLNEDLIFSPKVTKGDPFVEEYTVQAGDNPTKIARKRDLATEPSLIARVNKTDATKLRVGQKIKLVRGPFHAVVHKSDYRLDLFAGSPDDAKGWVYVRSFRTGLGEKDSTPVGSFVVKSGSKMVNPPWVNPRTGEKFDANDPKNPIGERWIGLEGIGAAAVQTGYGLHGTIDPDSIGQQKSMGCVRLGTDDVALLYELLVDKVSVVKIEP